MLQVSVYRYDPAKDAAPYMQDYSVDTGGKDLMVLDVLELLKAQDPSLSFRRSCREGVCGSDGMNINGKNGLACINPLSEVIRRNKLVLRPLPGLPVIRDLVIDMSLFYAQYEKVNQAMGANLAIYSAHIPLDIHPVYGNNVILCNKLGMNEPLPFHDWKASGQPTFPPAPPHPPFPPHP